MRLRLCCSLLGSVAVCTSSHKLHWCYFSCPIFCAGYVMGAVKQEQIWICTCWGFPLDVIPLDLFLSFWKSCFMSSGRSVAMPYFFHVLSSCQLRCQKVDLLKCSGFSFCLLVFRLFLGGFLFDWTSRSSLFWFELSEDNEVWRRCFCLSYFIWFWCGFHFASFGWIDPGFRPALKRIVPRTQLRARGEKRLLMYVCMYVCMHACMHAYVCRYVCMHACKYVYMYTFIVIHSHIYIYVIHLVVHIPKISIYLKRNNAPISLRRTEVATAIPATASLCPGAHHHSQMEWCMVYN